MKKKILLSLFSVATAALCLCLAMGGGGCGKKRAATVAPTACRPGPKPQARKPAIGRDAGLIGRLEERSVVKATLFHAEKGGVEKGEVELHPGTWLVPEATFIPPSEAEEK